MKVCKTDAERKKMIAESDIYHSLSKTYEQLFYYYDGILETKISQSVHPAGMELSSKLSENTGTCARTPTNAITINNVKRDNIFFILWNFGE